MLRSIYPLLCCMGVGSTCLSLIYLLVHLSVHPPILPSFHSPVHSSIHPSVCPSIYLSIYPSIYTPICPSICSSIHLSFHASIHLSIFSPICSFMHPFVSPSIHPSIHLSIFPSIHPSSIHICPIHPFAHLSIRVSIHPCYPSILSPPICLSIHPPSSSVGVPLGSRDCGWSGARGEVIILCKTFLLSFCFFLSSSSHHLWCPKPKCLVPFTSSSFVFLALVFLAFQPTKVCCTNVCSLIDAKCSLNCEDKRTKCVQG